MVNRLALVFETADHRVVINLIVYFDFVDTTLKIIALIVRKPWVFLFFHFFNGPLVTVRLLLMRNPMLKVLTGDMLEQWGGSVRGRVLKSLRNSEHVLALNLILVLAQVRFNLPNLQLRLLNLVSN